MQLVLAALLAIEAVLLAAAVYLGFAADSVQTTLDHVNAGILAAVFTLFIHCLVMFYLIGSGKAIKEAVEEIPDLAAIYVPFTRRQKKRVFPVATSAILLMLIASFAGAWIHGEILGAVPNSEGFPVRELPGWWLHLLLIIAALAVNAAAFAAEVGVVRDNVQAIRKLNGEIAARLEPAASPAGEVSRKD